MLPTITLRKGFSVMAAANITWKDVAMAVLSILSLALVGAWSDQRARIATLEGWKEGVAVRISLVEEKGRTYDESLKEIKGDLKEIKAGLDQLRQRR